MYYHKLNITRTYNFRLILSKSNTIQCCTVLSHSFNMAVIEKSCKFISRNAPRERAYNRGGSSCSSAAAICISCWHSMGCVNVKFWHVGSNPWKNIQTFLDCTVFRALWSTLSLWHANYFNIVLVAVVRWPVRDFAIFFLLKLSRDNSNLSRDKFATYHMIKRSLTHPFHPRVYSL